MITNLYLLLVAGALASFAAVLMGVSIHDAVVHRDRAGRS